MWEFEFQAPAGQRILNSRFLWIQAEGFLQAYGKKEWVSDDEYWSFQIRPGATNSYGCKSFKAFKRHLKNHPELKVSKEVRLVSEFVGYDVIAKWRGE
jgi:hypothetical protein